MTMFEVRILCRRLSSSSSSSILEHNNNNNNDNTTKKNVERQIRDYKRQSLAKTLEEYELQIEENESLYQEELLRLFKENDELSRQQSDQTENFINCLNTYLKQRVDARIRRIRYKETIFRIKLNRPRHRYSQPLTSLTANRTTNVYPEAIIEVSKTDQQQSFTDKELALLSSAGILISFYSCQKFCFVNAIFFVSQEDQVTLDAIKVFFIIRKRVNNTRKKK